MTTPNITVNIFNYGTDPASIFIDDLSGLTEAIKNRVLVADPDPIPRIVPAFTGKMEDGERRALWAAWNRVFDRDTTNTERYQFTRVVLGLPYDVSASWSRDGDLTSDQAYHLIRVLDTLDSIG